MHTLCLEGRLNKFPHWVSKLLNLRGLLLGGSKLIENPLKYLEDLPNLISLRLSNSYEGEELHFEEGGFPKLNELWLHAFERLKSVQIVRGILPLLKILKIESSLQLEEVPTGIQYLRNLKRLSIKNMPKEFVVRMEQNGGPDYTKIQHIPIIEIK